METVDKLREHIDFLKLLYKTHLLQKRALIDTASVPQLQILFEIVLNTVSGVIELDKETRDKLKKRRTILETILKKSTSKKRKQLLLRNNIKLLDILLEIVLNIYEENDSTG